MKGTEKRKQGRQRIVDKDEKKTEFVIARSWVALRIRE